MAVNEKSKKNLIPAKKGDVRNPNGRPRKSISSVANEMLATGVTVPSNEDIKRMYLLLFQLTKVEIIELVKDEEQPFFNRYVGKSILNGQGLDVIEKILDRAFGKAKQQTEVTGKDGEDLFKEVKITILQ